MKTREIIKKVFISLTQYKSAGDYLFLSILDISSQILLEKYPEVCFD